MPDTALKKRAKRALDQLSDEKIKVAVDFIDYLKGKDETDEALEILSSRELMAQIKEAEKSKKKGRSGDFVPWEKVKRNV